MSSSYLLSENPSLYAPLLPIQSPSAPSPSQLPSLSSSPKCQHHHHLSFHHYHHLSCHLSCHHHHHRQPLCSAITKTDSVPAVDSDKAMSSILQRLMVKMIEEGSAISRCAGREPLLSYCAITKTFFNDAKNLMSCPGAVWILSLIKFCGKHDVILKQMEQIQESLSSLLSDSRSLTQESASKGIHL